MNDGLGYIEHIDLTNLTDSTDVNNQLTNQPINQLS
jgi:hypothetical protein